MARADDAERLKVIAGRIAVLRQELAELREERDTVVARLRALPGQSGKGARVAIKVDYGADGEGLFLADLPRARAVARDDGAPALAVDPDEKDR